MGTGGTHRGDRSNENAIAAAGAALMIGTGAWAAGAGGTIQGSGEVQTEIGGAGYPSASPGETGTMAGNRTPATAETAAGGSVKSTLGSAGAPGATGSRGGSSTDSNQTTGGTGQPGTGVRQNMDQNSTGPLEGGKSR